MALDLFARHSECVDRICCVCASVFPSAIDNNLMGAVLAFQHGDESDGDAGRGGTAAVRPELLSNSGRSALSNSEM